VIILTVNAEHFPSTQSKHFPERFNPNLMKATITLVSLSLLAIASPLRAQVTSGSAVNAVLEWERVGCLAYQNNDAEAIDSLVADGYVLTDSRGHRTSKEDDLEAARTRENRYTDFHNEDMSVRIYENTAVVTGKTVLKGTARDGSTFDFAVLFTDTLVRRNGKWQLVAGHVSRPPVS
jgi:ketosteroid isomerase-like protein